MKKSYLIFGSTSGLGLDFTKKILIKKKDYIYCCGRKFEHLDSFVKKNKLENFYKKINIDFVKRDQFFKLNIINKIDFIVNYAGLVKNNLIKFYDNKLFYQLIMINLFSPINYINFLYKKNKINNNAAIVLLSSILGNKKVRIGSLGYAVGKSGLDAAIKVMALEMAEKNIRVNAISPGMVSTNFIEQIKEISLNDIKKDMKNYPLGNIYAKISEVNNLVNFLLSKKSSFITGQNIIIDGGLCLK